MLSVSSVFWTLRIYLLGSFNQFWLLVFSMNVSDNMPFNSVGSDTLAKAV